MWNLRIIAWLKRQVTRHALFRYKNELEYHWIQKILIRIFNFNLVCNSDLGSFININSSKSISNHTIDAEIRCRLTWANISEFKEIGIQCSGTLCGKIVGFESVLRNYKVCLSVMIGFQTFSWIRMAKIGFLWPD